MSRDNLFDDDIPESALLEEGEDDPGPSKSELKREMLLLQELGMKLMALRPGQWEKLGLGGLLREALDESLRIKSQNARRRHSRRLAKLLAEQSEEEILRWSESIAHPHRVQEQRKRKLEQLHDELLNGGDSAINEMLDSYPNLDRQRVRNIIRSSKILPEDRVKGRRDNKLMKYLNELIG